MNFALAVLSRILERRYQTACYRLVLRSCEMVERLFHETETIRGNNTSTVAADIVCKGTGAGTGKPGRGNFSQFARTKAETCNNVPELTDAP